MEEQGAKVDNSLLTPVVGGSGSNSIDSRRMRRSHTSKDFDMYLPESNDEASNSAEIFSTKIVAHTIPTESPLKRPHTPSAIPEPVEKRLQRPTNSNEEIPYPNTVATFAVDVSGSTKGRVLEEEKEAIRTLCGGLSRDAFIQADIIPWNNDVQPLICADELETLKSRGGTEPNKLNVSLEARTALSRCSAWFLLTDGEVDHLETRRFSNGICTTGLHGIPCVVILFGYMTARPVECNISVGLSVFSNAADCLFLFHDIDTTQVYILQSKGAFNAMLPSSLQELVLDTRTLWSDVPLFKYRQLFDLSLPARQQLQSDELLLQSRRKINLQDLYRNQIDSSTAGEILADKDNLQSVLLAAQIRGDDDHLRRWISEQSLSEENILLRERPDIDRRATNTMRALLSLLDRPIKDSEISVLQHDLRIAHRKNWAEFIWSLRTEDNERSERSSVVSIAMNRISSNRKEMDSGTNSPRILSPISSSRALKHNQYISHNNGPQNPYFPTSSSILPPSTPRPMHRFISGQSSAVRATQPDLRNVPPEITDSSDLRTLKSGLTGGNTGALYIQGYQHRPGEPIFEGTCPICEEDDVLLVLILKSPPTEISTPHFPRPNDRKGLAYPLAMGTYPETDILSSQISCDSCAYTMVQGKMAYDGDRVTAAIPIMQSAFSGEYQSTTSRLIDLALEKRFQKSSAELVFLSIIYSTLANLEGENVESRSEGLKKASSWIAETIQLPPCLSMSITGSTPQTSLDRNQMPMIEVLEDSIKDVEQPESPLLRYPVGGFVVLMLIITDLDLVKSTLVKSRQLAVWHRFLFHLVERHCALVAINPPTTILALQNIIGVSSADTDMDNLDDLHLKPITEIPIEHREKTKLQDEPRNVSTDSPIPVKSKVPAIDLSTVCQTHLLSEEDLEEFQRLGDLFEPVEDLCSAALHSFLRCLSQQVLAPSLAIDVFDKMRAQKDLHDVFVIS